MRILPLLYLTAFFFLSCSTGNTDEPANEVIISLSELSDIQVINDEMSYIDGAVYTYEPLGNGRAIISDQKPGLYLLEDNVMTAQYGREGQGPCEYTSVSGVDIRDDKLYVIDSRQTKIITYDVNTQECLDEFTSEGLNGFNYIHKVDDNDSFIIGNATYIGIRPDTTSLLRSIDSEGNYQDLGFELGRVNTVRSVVRLVAPGMEFVESSDKLYAYFPLTDSLYWYDLNDQTINSFPINIEIMREEIEEVTSDPSTFNPQDILDVINSGYTFVTRVIVSEDWIAVATAMNQDGEDTQLRRLKFFRPDGTYMGEVPYEENFLGIENGRLVQAIETTDPTAEFGYSIGYRDVIIE